MQKILIAERSEVLADALMAALQKRYNVHTCTDGNSALQMLEKLRPDALIIDLSLPVLDGLSVLYMSAYKPSVILALSPVLTPRVLQSATDAGVGYLFAIPCSVRSVIRKLDHLQEALP